MRDEWKPETSADWEDEPFDLPPEKGAYYEALALADQHQERMKAMSVAERNQFVRGLREGLTGPVPKRGDINNPLKKDMVPEPPAPRAEVAPRVRQHRPVNQMARARKFAALAKKAQGRKR